mgnify:CR=1 FL=1
MKQRSASQQKRFRKRLLDRHNAFLRGVTVTYIRVTEHIEPYGAMHCELCAQLSEQTELEAAHIIPLSTDAIDKEFLNSTENGLLLCVNCHIYIDTHKIYFDPWNGMIKRGHRLTYLTPDIASLISVKPFFAYNIGVAGWPNMQSLAIAAGLSRP